MEHSHKSYRPLCVLTFRLNYWIHELRPMGYHLGNVLLHCAVCLLFLRVSSMFLSEAASVAAALLFAAHPVHTEAEHSHKSYRPLCVLTFRLNYWIHELRPMGYHLGNVLLHCAVCLLFLRVSSMFLSEAASVAAALLFAAHPVHTEAVTGVVGRAESLSSVFFLLSFLAYSRCTDRWRRTEWRPLAACVALMVLATLSKEQGITVVAVCVVYEFLVVQALQLFACTALAPTPERPLLCLRCRKTGYIRKECHVLRCEGCRRFGHIRSECVKTVEQPRVLQPNPRYPRLRRKPMRMSLQRKKQQAASRLLPPRKAEGKEGDLHRPSVAAQSGNCENDIVATEAVGNSAKRPLPPPATQDCEHPVWLQGRVL
ncbi:hypothetical protein ISCGN_018967 [Ixodes scapularis]